jgi:Ca2+-binding EF-hand superfamily protein
MTSSRLSDADIRAVFNVFDATHTGEISREEMAFALKALGWNRVTDQDVTALFASFDSSGAKKSISLDEFTQLVRNKQKGVNSAEEIHAAFRLFDVDGNGKLSPDDLRRAGKAATGRPIPDELINEIMRVADADGDGLLSFEEFGSAVTKGHFVAPAELQKQTQTKERGNKPPQAPKAEQAKSSPGVVDVIASVRVTFHGGKIDRQEVRRALVEFGYDEATLTAEAFAEMFHDSDEDGDGKLTRDEYCRLLVGFGEIVDGY